MKPRMPDEIERMFPEEIVRKIYTFVPHLPKPKKSSPTLDGLGCSVSPNMERDLRLLQSKTLKGKSEMFLWELEDFVLR